MRGNFKLLNPGAQFPSRATPGSCGYDLFAPERVTIYPREQGLIKLGISWHPTYLSDALEDLGFGGFFAKIWDKSGLALKWRFSTRAGVIDRDYDKEWGLVGVNEGEDLIIFEAGDKVSQFVVLPFLTVDDLFTSNTERMGGFGSTGTT